MSTRNYDYVVVGSGAGGAILEELIQHDKNILAIEVGQNERVTDTLRDARSDYDGTKNIIPLLTKSKEGVIAWRPLMQGKSVL